MARIGFEAHWISDSLCDWVLPMYVMGSMTYLGNTVNTSNNEPSEKRSTSVQRTAHLPPIDFTIELIYYEPPRSGHLWTPNNGHWSAPDVPQPIISYLRKRTVKLAMSGWTSKFVCHNNNLYLWKEHEMAIPIVPISMRLGEYTKRYGLRNVTGLPNFFYVILAQYSGHYIPFWKPL